MLKPIDVLMVGVGGQGTILASKVLAAVAQAVGYDIKVSEIHGMAQRGGSVVTQVRLGEKVYSPLISEGEADVILAFEELEALRWLSYLKPGGIIIINNQQIYPVSVLAGAAEYPQNIIPQVQSRGVNVQVLQALEHAIACGNAKAANVVLLGALAQKLPIEEKIWRDALAATIPPRLLEVNNAAFTAGFTAATSGTGC
ncbi:indolepyruvate oxidoreductase subunit beta [Desulfoscipio gibsoniae]|uniref:2-oxoacid:ferredoxin oxidoreductase, gamma subunit n=1 Tax=Desulfoscipio gibsoniae DSM 7213 TaxID=767817 RepID=R4KW68_9FIRM|nr:indolepyruvate oxidoreductase subunit beta [Desulfoscipio gibsoniae]AGL03866.1 2-oxoacid:ferredoxin oxidoreductase, gamma subunit [Desulfoscipio gibsoniae DSM 7213]